MRIISPVEILAIEMFIIAIIGLLVNPFSFFLLQGHITSIFIGVGMAMLYPTLLAVVGDVADAQWRATSLGVYRMWRDGGYAVGALFIGFVI